MNNPTDALAIRRTQEYLNTALDPYQQSYVEARAAGAVPVVAARLAGYDDPEAKAVELEGSQLMRLAVESAIRVRASDLAITRRDVIEGLLDAVRNAANSTEQRLAWESLAKLLDMYSPKRVEVTGSIDVVAKQIKESNDNELAELAMDAEYKVLDFEED